MFNGGISVIVLIFVAMVLMFFNIYSSVKVGQYNCGQINTLKEYNLQSIHRAQKSLPTIAYYKEHPDELKDQLDYFREQEDNFQPIECASIFNPFPGKG